MSSFARCLIEVKSEVDLVDVVTIGIPSLTRDDFTKETIRVEYEWRPPKCKRKKRNGKSKTTNGGQSAGPSGYIRNMSASVARGHGGDGGGDYLSRPPPCPIGTGFQGVGGQKATREAGDAAEMEEARGPAKKPGTSG
ncbi:hypothetical protein Tco_0635570 [Tanacetum coccineum]